MNAADAHLAKDPVMAGLIERFGGPLVHEEDGEPDDSRRLIRPYGLINHLTSKDRLPPICTAHCCGRSPASSSP